MKKLLLLLLIAPTLAAAGEPVREAGFLGEFVAAKESIAPGETIDLALRIRHDPGFHTYWRAPGIVGVPTQIEWTRAGGLQPGEIRWPQPQVVKMGPYDAYGYEGEVFLLVPVTAPKDAQPGTEAQLTARVSFMVCPAVLSSKAGCHPGFVDIHQSLPVSEAPSKPTKWAGPIEAARKTFASPNTDWDAKARRDEKFVTLELEAKPTAKLSLPKKPHFYSIDGQVHSDSEQVITRRADGTVSIRMEISEFSPEAPTHLRGILYTSTGLPDESGAKPTEFIVPYPED